MTHSAGWDWVVPISGFIAISAIVVGRSLRPRFRGSALSTAIASVSFGVAAAAALGHWFDFMTGNLDFWGAVTHPAPTAACFAAIATTGAVASFMILVAWLRSRSVSL